MLFFVRAPLYNTRPLLTNLCLDSQRRNLYANNTIRVFPPKLPVLQCVGLVQGNFKSSIQHLKHKIRLQCGKGEIGSFYTHSIIAGRSPLERIFKLQENIPLTSCACFLVSPLYGPFKRRFKETGKLMVVIFPVFSTNFPPN